MFYFFYLFLSILTARTRLSICSQTVQSPLIKTVCFIKGHNCQFLIIFFLHLLSHFILQDCNWTFQCWSPIVPFRPLNLRNTPNAWKEDTSISIGAHEKKKKKALFIRGDFQERAYAPTRPPGSALAWYPLGVVSAPCHPLGHLGHPEGAKGVVVITPNCLFFFSLKNKNKTFN
jgi:hypothetical protein